MAYSGLSFSRYAHTYERDGAVAIFHSLKMKPVFLDLGLHGRVRDVITSAVEYTAKSLAAIPQGPLIQEACRLLLENRVLNDRDGRDDEVIAGFRRGLVHPHIKIAYFILAESCNLACRYCFERTPGGQLSTKLMSRDTAAKCLDFYERALAEYPSLEEDKDIIFYGGEPLLNYDTLLYILREIRRRREEGRASWERTTLSIVTNGTLLTLERVKELSAMGLGLGISIDGPEDVTNSNRVYRNGRGSFGDASRAIETCKAADVPFSLSITLSEAAVRDYDRVMDFVWNAAPASIGFNVLMSQTGESQGEAYAQAAADFLIRAFAECRERGLYEDRMMRKANAFATSRVYPFDCGATGGNQLVFAPSGQVGVCHGYISDKKYFPTTVDDAAFSAGEQRQLLLPVSDNYFCRFAAHLS